MYLNIKKKLENRLDLVYKKEKIKTFTRHH